MKRSAEERELIQNWLRFAGENLMSAKSLFEEEFAPFHTVCYMCQGAAEKYLKAYLIWQGWSLEKTHDLRNLLKHCLNYDSSFIELSTECSELNEYIVEGRYPGDLPWEGIGKTQAEEAIEAADKIARFVTERIQFEPGSNGEVEDLSQ